MTEPGLSVPELGTLERIEARTIWKHEAHDFTPWLAENADRLADALGIELEIIGTEHRVGRFSLDIFGRDLSHDQPLIVENQLEASDHGHLGQLLTYAAGTDAQTIVWIAPRIHEEHRQALAWLNEHTGPDTHFFGVEIEVVHIGDSARAPLFNVAIQPNDWQKAVRAATTSDGSARSALYQEFWSRFLDRLREDRPHWSRARSAPAQNWFSMTVGLPPGMQASPIFSMKDRIRTELYIDTGDVETTKAIFDHLFAQRAAFEEAYGRPLEWERLDDKRASRIAEYRPGSITRTDEHGEYIDWFIDTGTRLRAAVAAVDASPPASPSI